jgi:hypothetical protein
VNSHTKALLEEHTLEENILLIFSLVSHTNLSIQRAKLRLDEVHGPHSIWSEANSSSIWQLDKSTRLLIVTLPNIPYDRVLFCTLIQGKGNTPLVKAHGQSQPSNAGPCIDVSKASPYYLMRTLANDGDMEIFSGLANHVVFCV